MCTCSGCGTSSWEQEAPLEHEPPTGRSWDACPGITQGSNKAFFSSLNQASRMGCLLAFVFGANQQIYSGQHNGIVGLQWKLGRGPGPPLQRAHPEKRFDKPLIWLFGIDAGFWWASDLLLVYKIVGSIMKKNVIGHNNHRILPYALKVSGNLCRRACSLVSL